MVGGSTFGGSGFGLGFGSSQIPDRHLTDPADPDSRFAPNDRPLVKGSIEDMQHTVNQVKACFEFERQARMPHEYIWDKVVERVNNRYPFRRQEWQSQKMLPAMAIFAFKMAWELTKQLELAGKEWFQPVAQDSSWKDYGILMRDLVASFLDTGGESPEDDFLTTFYDLIFMGLQMQGCHALVMTANDGIVDMLPSADSVFETKPTEAQDSVSKIPPFGFGSVSGKVPEEEKPPPLPGEQKFRMRIDAFNPRNVYLDSSGSRIGTYRMWTQNMRPGEFREVAEKSQWRNIEEVIAGRKKRGTTELDQAKKQRDKNETPNQRPDNIELLHFWGTLYDEDSGDVIFKNQYWIQSGEFDIYGPVDNPFWHGKIPIISCGLLRKPHTTYHESLLSLNLDAQDALVEMINMVLDQLHWSINPPVEVDWDQLHSQRQNQITSKGVFPGMVLHLQKGQRGYPALSRMITNGPGSDTYQGVGFVKQILTEYSGAGEAGAMPRTRNRISAQESKERAANSVGIMEQVFLNIQRNLLEPILYQGYLVLLQKIPQELWAAFFNEKIKEYEAAPQQQTVMIERLKKMVAWTATERYQNLGAVFRFKVDVFSANESKRDMLEKLGMFVEACSKAPPLLARTNFQYIGEEYARNLDLDPAKVMLPLEQPSNAGEGGPPAGEQIPGVPNPVGPVTTPPGLPR